MLLGCCWFAAEFLLLLLLPIAMPILGHHRNPRLGVIGAHVQQRREGERQTERQRDREGGEVKIFLAHILSFFFFVFLSLSLSLPLSLSVSFYSPLSSFFQTGRQNGRGCKCNLVISLLTMWELH